MTFSKMVTGLISCCENIKILVGYPNVIANEKIYPKILRLFREFCPSYTVSQYPWKAVKCS